MARHHDDPDAAFNGWCDVWLDPAFRDWSLEPDAERGHRARAADPGRRRPLRQLEQLDRIEARVRGPASGSWSRAATARTSSSLTPVVGGDRGLRGGAALAAALPFPR